MPTELRNTGISIVGDAPWGTHFCYFYETKQDLLSILVPYFKAGLESKEFCLWIVSDSELITTEEAKEALAEAVPDLDGYVAEGRIEITSHDEWFLRGGAFDFHRVAYGFKEKLDEALANGYAGLRINGSPAWIETLDANVLREFEGEADRFFANEHIIASCTYPLVESQADFLLDVARSHQFVIARRQGKWDVLETPQLLQAKQEIQRLNEELEQRVSERTKDLAAANEELKEEIAERKQAEADLRQQKEILQQIFDHIPVMINFVGADGRIKLVNREWERTLGWPLEEIRQQNVDVFAECYPDPQYRQQVLKFVAEAEGEWADFKTRVRDGRVIDTSWVRVHLSDGTSIGIGTDITERKQAEDVLRRSEDHLRLVLDTTPALIHTGRPDGYLDYFNQRWLKYVGRSLEELQDWGWTATIHPDDVEGIVNAWRVSLASGEPFQYEARVRRADGEYRWTLHHKVPLRDEHGNIVKWHGSSLDIEDRKRAEEKLKQSERQLAEAQHLAHVGGWDWDIRSNVVTWSDELYRIFGLEPGKIKAGGDAMPFIHPEDRDLVLNTVKTAVKNKEPYSFYYRVLRPDGDERIVHSRGHILSDEHGEPLRVFGATQDITELKRAEENLKATSDQLRALSTRLQSVREEEATRIAREIHDELGSALTRLKWDLELLSKERLKTQERVDRESSGQKIDEMIQLVDETVNTVRRISSQLRPSILDDLGLAAALRWHAEQFQNRTGIVTDCDCSVENLGLNQAQSTAVFRIFEEALTNVMRHAGATKVDVRLEKDKGDLVVTIQDNGRGITEAERLDPSSLGLLGMRERVNLIGGEISIAGIAGEGTVVTVRLPISGKH